MTTAEIVVECLGRKLALTVLVAEPPATIDVAALASSSSAATQNDDVAPSKSGNDAPSKEAAKDADVEVMDEDSERQQPSPPLETVGTKIKTHFTYRRILLTLALGELRARVADAFLTDAPTLKLIHRGAFQLKIFNQLRAFLPVFFRQIYSD